MVAPKSLATACGRSSWRGGRAGLVAVHQDASGSAQAVASPTLQALASPARGAGDHLHRGDGDRPLREKAVLCGGASALVKAGFETLVNAGYQPEIAYFECMHELKLIVDLMYRRPQLHAVQRQRHG